MAGRKNYAGRDSLKDTIATLYSSVEDGFKDKLRQARLIQEFWDIYDCILGQYQKYMGEHQVYLPFVHDAIEARQTRFANAIFPHSGRYVDVVAESGDTPYATMSLLDHYVRKSKLRTIVPALLRSGDVEGHYTISVEWYERTTSIKVPTKKKPTVQMEDGSSEEDPAADEVADIEDTDTYVAYPKVSIHSASDVVVLPPTIDDIDEAEIVAISMRVTKTWLKDKIKTYGFKKQLVKDLCAEYDGLKRETATDNDENRVAAAGVRMDGKEKAIVVWRVFQRAKFAGDEEMGEFFYGGDNRCLYAGPLGLWGGKVPVLSAPQEKVEGSFWGKSKLDAVAAQQYAANDVINMALDSMRYGVMPIVLTDPEKNPRYASMVLTMAAVWETNPKDTQFASMPQVWKDCLPLVSDFQQKIWQSLNVNPSMVAQGGGGKKPSQGQIAQEQQVELASTADVVVNLEGNILEPLVEMFFEFDQQFRKEKITVRQFGRIGYEASMEEVEPLQFGTRYYFRWYGMEQVRSLAQQQQKIALMNVLRGMPPQALNGRKLDVGPLLDQLAEEVFGPRIAPRILIDERHQQSLPPELENEMLQWGFPVEVMPADNDQQHLAAHQEEAKKLAHEAQGNPDDPHGPERLKNTITHMRRHMQQMQAKAAASMGIPPSPMEPPRAQMQQPGVPGVPGGAPPQMQIAPGVAGTPHLGVPMLPLQRPGGVPVGPRMGAQPGTMRPMQQPPGAISRDNLPFTPNRKVAG